MNSDTSGNSEDQSSEKSSQIDAIAERFLNELIAKKSPDRASIVAQHPELAPELDQKLRLIEIVFSTFDEKSDRKESTGDQDIDLTTQIEPSDQGSITQQVARRISCPHCGNKLQIVDVKRDSEITCASCGSTVLVDAEATYTLTGSPKLPKKIGRFPIVSYLGQGGFGTVYKAWDDVLSRYVAIKIPRSEYFLGDSERRRFLREARNAGQLQHANIVRVHDVAEENGTPFIVSDFIDGLTLSDLISSRRLSFEETARLMVLVAEAIAHAHEHHIIHRDIKPSNILVDLQLKPHITDFGLARDSSAEIAITIHGEVLGTPAYMSPEQARGESNEVDFRCDVYSLGVVLYRLLSGELPFRGSRRMLMHQLINEEPQTPRKINENVPRDLETITLKAMNKEPQNRYQTALEFSEDLRRWLNHEPIKARPISRLGRLKKWCRRRPLVASLSFTIATLTMLAVVLSIVWAVRENVLRRIANDNFKDAQANHRESTRRLTKLYVQNGMRNLNQNKLVDSLAWFLEASGSELDDPSAHRIRTRLVADQCPTLTGMWRMNGRVIALGFTSDGDQFFAGASQGQIHLYPSNASSMERKEFDCAESIYDVKLSSDNQLMLARADQRYHLWNVTNGNRVSILDHQATVAGFAFSSNSNLIATTDHEGLAKVWNRQGELVVDLAHPNRMVTWTEFSPDSTKMLTVSRKSASDPSEIRIWDLNEQKEIQMFSHGLHVNEARFDATGSRIVSADNDKTIRIWNVSNGEEVGAPRLHASPVRQVFWVDDKTIVAVTQDGQIVRWDDQTDSRIDPEIQYAVKPTETTIGNQARIVASAHVDGYVRVSWLKFGTPVCSHLPCGDVATKVAIHSTERIILAADNNGIIKKWDLAGSLMQGTDLKHAGAVVEAKFNPRGDKVATASRDMTARLWNAVDGRAVAPAIKHESAVLDIDFDSTGSYFATVSADATARVWDAHNSQAVGPPMRHDHPIFRTTFGPNELLFTGDSAGVIRAWKVLSDTPEFELKHDEQIRSLAANAASNLLASTSTDNSAKIWPLNTTTKPSLTISHDDDVTYCQFSHDGKWFVSCGRDRYAKVVSTSGQRTIQTLPHASGVSSATFNHDDTLLATISFDGRINIWKMGTEIKLETSFSYPELSFVFVQFHPTKPWLIACGKRNSSTDNRPGAGVVLILDVENHAPISPLMSHAGAVRRSRFNNNGDQVLTASSDQTARIWNIQPDRQSVPDQQRMVAVLLGRSLNAQSQLESLDSKTQYEYYLKMRQQFPEWFTCSTDEIDDWNSYVDRWFNDH